MTEDLTASATFEKVHTLTVSITRAVPLRIRDERLQRHRSLHQLVRERGLRQVVDASAINDLIDDVLDANPAIGASVRDNPKALNARLGRVMKVSGGTAKPDLVRALPRDGLDVEEP